MTKEELINNYEKKLEILQVIYVPTLQDSRSETNIIQFLKDLHSLSPAENKWLSWVDTPEKTGNYLVSLKDGGKAISSYHTDSDHWSLRDVIYWMPIPPRQKKSFTL